MLTDRLLPKRVVLLFPAGLPAIGDAAPLAASPAAWFPMILALFIAVAVAAGLVIVWNVLLRRSVRTQMAALAETRRKLSSALLAGEVGTFEWDITGAIVSGDSNFAKMFGIQLDENGAAPLSDYVAVMHPDDQERVRTTIARTVDHGVDYDIEYRVISGGVTRWLLVRAKPERDAAGRVFRASGVCLDITERKLAEDAMRNSEQRFRALVEATAQIVWTADGNGATYEDSPSWRAFTGQTLQEWLDWGWSEAIHPEDREATAAEWRRCLKEKVLYRVEYRLRHHSGDYRWMLVRAVPLLNVDGTLKGWVGMCMDVNEQKEAEARLRLQSAALEAAANGMAITDARGTILWANPAYSRLTGYSREELIGQNHRILKSTAQDESFYRDLWSTISQGHVWRGELVNRRKDGSVYTEEQTITPVPSEGGPPSYFIAVKQDITARKLVEEALNVAKVTAEEASRAKDHFLAVLSHELRTPLTPVTAALSIMETDERLPDDIREELAMVQRNVELETRLIDDLLDLTRIARGKISLNRRTVELCHVLEHVAQTCASDLEARNIHFGMNLKCEKAVVEGDSTRLHQVFWNILKNAIKFTPSGGCIGLSLWHEDEHVIVEISDSGRGIAPHLVPDIFNAFEQGSADVTKQFGGLGLGLAICRALVDLHGGMITAHSEGPGQGASFRVRLPAATSPTAPTPAVVAPRPHRREQEPLNVLLVEDHGDTARIMKRFLNSRGHQVTVAGDVATGLEAARQSNFDVLISDLGLPDGSGLDLIGELRRSGSTVPAIALSGYGQEDDLRRSREAGFTEHLVKPVDVRRLQITIEEVVSESRSSS